MEWRILLAFALSALVLLLYPVVMRRFLPPPAAPGQPAAVSVPAPPPQASPAVAAAPAVSAPRQAAQQTETVVENDLYRVAFSNRGAVVKSWTLKRYRDERGRPLELVNQPAAARFSYPFSVWSEDEALGNKLKEALFQVRATGGHAPATITFEFSDGTLWARKEFRFEKGSYVAEVSSTVQEGTKPAAHLLAWQGSFGDQSVANASQTVGVVTATPARMARHGYRDIKQESRLSGPFTYAGLEDLYFAAVYMPPDGAPADAAIAAVRTFRSEYRAEGSQAAQPLIGVGVGGAGQNRLRVFVGPKALDVLNSVHPEPDATQRLRQGQPVLTLGDLVDFGWFSFIAKPLFLALKWVYDHLVPNYGWAIVLITVVINVLLFPLKLKSMRSALKMQKIAPQIKAIQEKYKKLKLNDPRRQQQNQEVMDLYRKHGINPMGGCFPMLLQIPFLYAFYKVLALSIEMRQAPWILWIRDLSAKDPYYVLPIVMVVTMFILQKMTPMTTTDPAQQKMFLMMPLIFGIMFFNVSSGLVLYWLVGNIVGIAQQWYINRVGLGAAAQRKPALVK